jgi:hypothetical protein
LNRIMQAVAKGLSSLSFALSNKLCDGGCGKKNPTKICSGCNCYYYCSRECQISHRRKHKEDCNHVKKITISETKKAKAGPKYTNDQLDREMQKIECSIQNSIESTDCPICFEEFVPKTSMVKLDRCGHMFCCRCLHGSQEPSRKGSVGDWSTPFQTFPCPLCRCEIHMYQHRFSAVS